MLGSHREPAHVGVNVNGLKQAVDSLIRVGLQSRERSQEFKTIHKPTTESLIPYLLVAVGRIDVVSCRVVAASGLGVQAGRLAKGRSRLGPLFGHLEEVGRPLVAVNGFLDFVGAIAENIRKKN